MALSARAGSVSLQAATATGTPRVTHVRDFVAMGTQFSVTVVDCDIEVAAALERRVHKLEASWSRFRDSDLMRANNSPDVAVPVSEDTVRLVRAMRRGWELTDGLFNPNVLGEMIDRGFAVSKLDSSHETHWSARATTGATFADVVLDEHNGLLTVPSGVGLDPGGIGKGLAADLVVDLGLGLGARGVLVFAGGDVRLAGLPPVGDTWFVEVEDPHDQDATVATLRLTEAGIATSSPLGWTSGTASHIVRHGADAAAVVQATVAAGSAADAEVLTKACYALSPQDSVALVQRLGADLLLLLDDGGTLATTGWQALCE